MDFALDDHQLTLQAHAREVAAGAVARYGRHNDSWINGWSKEFARELGALGWIGMTWPAEHGGGGRPPIERLIVAEELIAAGAPIAAMWFADRQMGPTLIAYGSADQQRAFLPGILSGEDTWCIGMSEPGAGSDLAGLTTSARAEGDEWVIDGQKIWTSFGVVAAYCYLICRTSKDGPPHRGISEIVVPMDTPGIEVRPITDMTTNRHFCEVFFDGVRVPRDNLVGAEGGAFKQTMRQLEHERGGIDDGCDAVDRVHGEFHRLVQCLSVSLRYLRERRVGCIVGSFIDTQFAHVEERICLSTRNRAAGYRTVVSGSNNIETNILIISTQVNRASQG